MEFSETAQLFLGASLGLAVILAALLASTASIRASQSWESHHRVKATAFASFAGISGVMALAGIVYGLILIALSSPFAS